MSMIEFCVDFLRILRVLQAAGEEDRYNGYPYAVSRMLMVVLLGFSTEDVDDASDLLLNRMNNNSIGDLDDAIGRLINFCEDKENLKKRIVSAMAAILQVQMSKVTPDQKHFVDLFQGYFDLKPSDFQSALYHGADIGISVTFTADEFNKATAKNQLQASVNSAGEKTK